MTALAVIPPDEYLGAVESIPTFVGPIEKLVADGLAYAVPAPDASREGAQDYYFEVPGTRVSGRSATSTRRA